jgi:hypothetical protein
MQALINSVDWTVLSIVSQIGVGSVQQVVIVDRPIGPALCSVMAVVNFELLSLLFKTAVSIQIIHYVLPGSSVSSREAYVVELHIFLLGPILLSLPIMGMAEWVK